MGSFARALTSRRPPAGVFHLTEPRYRRPDPPDQGQTATRVSWRPGSSPPRCSASARAAPRGRSRRRGGPGRDHRLVPWSSLDLLRRHRARTVREHAAWVTDPSRGAPHSLEPAARGDRVGHRVCALPLRREHTCCCAEETPFAGGAHAPPGCGAPRLASERPATLHAGTCAHLRTLRRTQARGE